MNQFISQQYFFAFCVLLLFFLRVAGNSFFGSNANVITHETFDYLLKTTFISNRKFIFFNFQINVCTDI